MTGNDDDERPDATGEAGDWPVHDRVVVWENPFFDAGYDVVERPDGQRANYYWIDPADVTVVVPVIDDEVVLVETYSPQLQGTSLACPAGRIEPDEQPHEAAARELREETGYVAGDLTEIERFRAEAWVRADCTAYLATDLEPGDPDLDEGEFLAVERVPIDDAVTAVRDSEVVHGVQFLPLLLAREDGLV